LAPLQGAIHPKAMPVILFASSDNTETQKVILPAAFKRKSFPPTLALI
jgi:hypothetical protein